MSKDVQIVHSMFPDIVPTKLDVAVDYEIVKVSNYKVSMSDNGRNIAAVRCLNTWPIKNGTVRCKGNQSIYHYQWMNSDNVARCNKCGCKWMYDREKYRDAHINRYDASIAVDSEYPLVNVLEVE